MHTAHFTRTRISFKIRIENSFCDSVVSNGIDKKKVSFALGSQGTVYATIDNWNYLAKFANWRISECEKRPSTSFEDETKVYRFMRRNEFIPLMSRQWVRVAIVATCDLRHLPSPPRPCSFLSYACIKFKCIKYWFQGPDGPDWESVHAYISSSANRSHLPFFMNHIIAIPFTIYQMYSVWRRRPCPCSVFYFILNGRCGILCSAAHNRRTTARNKFRRREEHFFSVFVLRLWLGRCFVRYDGQYMKTNIDGGITNIK